MEPNSTHIVVFITTSSKQEAETIGKALIESRLAACVNIISAGVHSLFWWQGVIERQDEMLMLVKSRSDLLPSIIELVKELHSYTVPEVIALPIVAGSPDYLTWVDESLR
ncbi:MAG: divalent-cation tolerance protein CutA [Candidatus Methylomirabilis oxygeniifera]|uniref:Divalent-cation tolerance protein cutA n=1 Tax=Methylomirabilis oxygeniifera TaxID=671143 RepID=D5ML03_METO1|nr:MAG: divalent-cation tolerance protein CutA [Candidatus Methylomirabilis oxyfera]CBE69843.1 Divalent-cation tolerance protein cutA [Candidatus Methylomirabilis oxyfera]